jgi:hypothetical protein
MIDGTIMNFSFLMPIHPLKLPCCLVDFVKIRSHYSHQADCKVIEMSVRMIMSFCL